MPKTKSVTISLQVDDAEIILRTYGEMAAKYGALCDYITARTIQAPSHSFPIAERKKDWDQTFRRAKRVVESFGVEYSPTSEQETLGVYFPPMQGTGTDYVPDYKNPKPQYCSGIHAEACHQAAARVVRAWRATLSQ